MAQRIKLTIPQTQIWQHPARFKPVIAGRRFGKTKIAIARLYSFALFQPNQNIWYVAPTFRMSKRLAWKPLKKLIDPRSLKTKNETDLTIELLNGSTISLFGADNPDGLRGDGINHVILDEFPLMKSEVWTEAIRPALADKMGSADLLGTPKGFNYAYDICQEAMAKPSWHFFQFTTAQGGNVPLAEIEDAKSSMDARTFKQEFEASFEALTGRVYDRFERVANVDEEITDTGAELLIGLDFNISPLSAVVAVAAGDQCHVLDSIELMASNTEEMAIELKKRYPKRSIICYPDPSGNARKTSAPVGQTDFTILKRHGFRIVAPPQAPLIVDKINAVQAMLCTTDGKRRLLIHTNAKELIKGLEGHTYIEGTSIPDKTQGLDHITDALAYMIWSRFNLLKSFSARGSGLQLY